MRATAYHLTSVAVLLVVALLLFAADCARTADLRLSLNG